MISNHLPLLLHQVQLMLLVKLLHLLVLRVSLRTYETTIASIWTSFFVGAAWNYGQCITDSFSIGSPGLGGSPIICGTNTGYHSKYIEPSLRVGKTGGPNHLVIALSFSDPWFWWKSMSIGQFQHCNSYNIYKSLDNSSNSIHLCPDGWGRTSWLFTILHSNIQHSWKVMHYHVKYAF